MTENEHSIVTALAQTGSAKSVLRDICPGLTPDCITTQEWQQVMQILMKWETKLTASIDTIDSE